ncbi:H-NS histone family protein [Paraburkholderia tropica]|uniref:H-NS histone family protein n=1 Tax=Paraburkholderia tropica TaxID=92647 RepID=UPI001F387083|nr:H-NS histone family protein [Paraburkholderia tropica]
MNRDKKLSLPSNRFRRKLQNASSGGICSLDEVDSALEKIRDLMHKYSVSSADIEAFVGKRRGCKPSQNATAKAGASAPKYVDPKTGATWTGHGRAPQ